MKLPTPADLPEGATPVQRLDLPSARCWPRTRSWNKRSV